MFNWINFMSYAIATAITPGPNNITSLSLSSRMGFSKSYPFNFGVLVGFFSVIVICTVFCDTLSSFLPVIKLPMLILGALYMLWLAWKTFRSSDVEEKKNSKGGFWSGVLLQFVNVKGYLYAIVSMEAYILPYYAGKWDKLLLFAFMLACMGFVSTCLWGIFGSLFKMLFSKYSKITNTIMALLLVYCAVSLFF